jgi:hypothetical protein
MGAQGIATIDAGAIGSNHNEVTYDVTGQTGILAAAQVEGWVTLEATAEHSIDEHRIEDLDVRCGNVVAGTGFTIYLRCRNGRIYGNWKIGWVWN